MFCPFCSSFCRRSQYHTLIYSPKITSRKGKEPVRILNCFQFQTPFCNKWDKKRTFFCSDHHRHGSSRYLIKFLATGKQNCIFIHRGILFSRCMCLGIRFHLVFFCFFFVHAQISIDAPLSLSESIKHVCEYKNAMHYSLLSFGILIVHTLN